MSIKLDTEIVVSCHDDFSGGVLRDFCDGSRVALRSFRGCASIIQSKRFRIIRASGWKIAATRRIHKFIALQPKKNVHLL